MERPAPPDSPIETLPYKGPSGGKAAGGRYGRFVTIGVLGSGGMGVVLSAYDPTLDRNVAIKLLRPDLWGSEAAGVERLWREAQAMAKLSHPNVVAVYESGHAGGREFLAMELVEGMTLRAWQAYERRWEEIVEMYVGAGRGLAAAHAAGLVHRDFKPENVLIGHDGRPRVGDFGLVAEGVRVDKTDVEGAPTETGLAVGMSWVGTPAYMAPEQWEGVSLDGRADQFSFCVALWEALYGSAPFGLSGDATELRRAVLAGEIRAPARSRGPAWLEGALRRGLERDPARRWPSMAPLLGELSRGAVRRRRVSVAFAAALAATLSGAALAAVLGALSIAAAIAATTTDVASGECAGRELKGARSIAQGGERE
jgi:eukaryotic-like serine/threonine-protein kinase